MKIDITFPEQLAADAKDLAERLGISWDELFVTALAEFVARHRDAEVTRRLDAVYSEESSSLAPDLQAAQRRTLRRAEW